MRLGKGLAALGVAGICQAGIICLGASTTEPAGGVVAATSPAATEATNRPPTLEELKAQNKADTIDKWANLPSLPARAVSEVLKVYLVEGNLNLDSPLVAKELPETRIPLTDVAGSAKMSVHRVQGTAGWMAAMDFENWDFTPAKLVYRFIQVQAQPRYVQIVRSVEFADQKIQTVSLDQNYAIEAPLMLRVQVAWENNGGVPFNLAVSGANIVALRHDHPAEFEKYLRPVFHELRQEKAIFGVDDTAAWQVLADTWVCPADVPDKVKPAVEALNAEDYAARAKALKDLKGMGKEAALYLMTMSRVGLSAEQNGQIDALLRPYHPFSDEHARQLRHDVDFLLDCLYSDDSEVREAALAHLSTVVGHAVKLETGESAGSDPVAKLRDELVPSLEME